MSTNASNASENKKVTLKSCDEVEFKVDIPVASRSILLKNMIEGMRLTFDYAFHEIFKSKKKFDEMVFMKMNPKPINFAQGENNLSTLAFNRII